MRPQSLLVIATVLALQGRAAAQQPGERVRLTTGAPAPRVLIGTFVAQDAESVWVELPGQLRPVAVARTAAAQLEVSGGVRRRTIAGAQIGAGLGAIGGFVLGGLAASHSEPCGSLIGGVGGEVCVSDWYGRAFRSSLIGAALGGAIGAVFGAALRTEHWSPVPLGPVQHITVAPFGVGVALSFAF